jgi:hypothetical protein
MEQNAHARTDLDVTGARARWFLPGSADTFDECDASFFGWLISRSVPRD